MTRYLNQVYPEKPSHMTVLRKYNNMLAGFKNIFPQFSIMTDAIITEYGSQKSVPWSQTLAPLDQFSQCQDSLPQREISSFAPYCLLGKTLIFNMLNKTLHDLFLSMCPLPGS